MSNIPEFPEFSLGIPSRSKINKDMALYNFKSILKYYEFRSQYSKHFDIHKHKTSYSSFDISIGHLNRWIYLSQNCKTVDIFIIEEI